MAAELGESIVHYSILLSTIELTRLPVWAISQALRNYLLSGFVFHLSQTSSWVIMRKPIF